MLWRFIKFIKLWILILLIFGVIFIKFRTDSVYQTASIIATQQVQSDIILVKERLAENFPAKVLNLKFTQDRDFYIFINSRDDDPYIVYAGALTSPYEVFYCKNGLVSKLKAGEIDKKGAVNLVNILK